MINSFYAMPVSSLGHFRTEWMIVIAESLPAAVIQVENSIMDYEFLSKSLHPVRLGPAHEEDVV